MDQSKKTMRHFYCRDVLWETFEQMANDFDCSIDYLINEAMRYYARSKNYQSAGGPQSQPPGQSQVAAAASLQGASMQGGAAAQSYAGAGAPMGAQGYPTPGPNPAARRPAPTSTAPPSATSRPPPQRPGPTGAQPAQSMAGAGAGLGSQPPGQPVQAPSRQPAGSPPPSAYPQTGANGPTLYLIYNGQRYPVVKDQFIIGRGSKTSDLAIKDGNISRKHAAVIRRNGTFYIKDLGSTNGIDYKGMRIDNKRIDEGDVFHLCDYELRFTYRTE